MLNLLSFPITDLILSKTLTVSSNFYVDAVGPSDLNEILDYVKREWKALPRSICWSSHSMPRRIEAVDRPDLDDLQVLRERTA